MIKKVLLIEDDITLRDLYFTRFSMEDYDLEVATDGEAGLAKVKEFKPSAVLLDLRIPKLTGFEVLRRIKEDPETKDIPVIIFTALSGDDDRKKCLDAGAAAFLSKAETMPKDVIEKMKEVMGA